MPANPPPARLLRRHARLQLLGGEADDVLVLVRVEIKGLGVEILELHAAGEHRLLPCRLLGLARMEFRHHLGGEELEAGADVLMAGAAGLVQQDDLVDMRRLELPEPRADGLGRADEAALQRRLRLLGPAPVLILLPEIAGARRVDAFAAVIGEREDEEGPARCLLDRFRIGRRAHEAVDDGDVGVQRIFRERLRMVQQHVVVFVDPGARRFGRDEAESQRAHAPFAGLGDGLDVGAGDPERRVRLLQRLRDHVARGEIVILAVEFPILAGEHRHDGLHRLLPALALVAHPDGEGMELGRPRRLTHAELDAAAGDQIERGDALGDALRLVGGELHDAVAEADALGALARRGEEHLGRRAMGIFLEEMMLDRPDIVVAELVGELDLGQRILQQRIFAGLAPRARQLMLVEDAEFHPALPWNRARPTPLVYSNDKKIRMRRRRRVAPKRGSEAMIRAHPFAAKAPGVSGAYSPICSNAPRRRAPRKA